MIVGPFVEQPQMFEDFSIIIVQRFYQQTRLDTWYPTRGHLGRGSNTKTCLPILWWTDRRTDGPMDQQTLQGVALCVYNLDVLSEIKYWPLTYMDAKQIVWLSWNFTCKNCRSRYSFFFQKLIISFATTETYVFLSAFFFLLLNTRITPSFPCRKADIGETN